MKRLVINGRNCLFIDTDGGKKEKEKKAQSEITAFSESEGERISDHCSVRCIRRSVNKRLKKPANNTRNRTANTPEIAVLSQSLC